MTQAALRRAAVLALLFVGICVASTLTMLAAAWAAVSWGAAGDFRGLGRVALALVVVASVTSALRNERSRRHETDPS